MSNGYFISFEGVDGSGKSTQISKLKEYLEESGYDVILSREPGGTQIGEQIRSVILDPANREMTAVTEALLYAASRAQHVHDVIAPAVKEGKIVICGTCESCLKEIAQYCWEDGGTGRDRPRKEKDHAMDEMRYFAMSIAGKGRGGGAAMRAVERAAR